MNENVKIITNNHWRLFDYFWDFTAEEQATIKSDYDHMSNDEIETGDWFKYRGRFYGLCDFMSLHNTIHCPNPPESMRGWDGYLSDSFFSGVLIKISDCRDAYKIATFIS